MNTGCNITIFIHGHVYEICNMNIYKLDHKHLLILNFKNNKHNVHMYVKRKRVCNGFTYLLIHDIFFICPGKNKLQILSVLPDICYFTNKICNMTALK